MNESFYEGTDFFGGRPVRRFDWTDNAVLPRSRDSIRPCGPVIT